MISFSIYLFIVIPVVNYILYSLACYLDHRFGLEMENRNSNTGKLDPFNSVQIALFGFLPMIGITIFALLTCIYETYLFFKDRLKLGILFSLHKKLGDLGKIQRQQANDPDYQAEKYLLGKK